jgi:hypothetical protein
VHQKEFLVVLFKEEKLLMMFGDLGILDMINEGNDEV